jgi:hypothetical protein
MVSVHSEASFIKKQNHGHLTLVMGIVIVNEFYGLSEFNFWSQSSQL